MSFDVVIVGAGPTGLACAAECARAGLSHIVIEKGCIVNSIYHFPANMVFFTTSELLEIGDVPFTSPHAKPTREEGLGYYKRVVSHWGLNIHSYERVISIDKSGGTFRTIARDRQDRSLTYLSSYVIIATGYYDQPNRLGIPGEDLPKVSHYYTDPHPFFNQNVLVIGGKNSACIAALELYRYGARVTMIHRRSEIKESVKYWILPDFLNRVKEAAIQLHLESVATRITEDSVTIRNVRSGEEKEIKNDYVFALTGYHPDATFLRSAGIEVDETSLIPRHNEQTMETNVPGLFIAGSISAGRNTNKLFIENGRFHGRTIVQAILKTSHSIPTTTRSNP